MNDQATRCKHCGKVIVGNAKLGLCDSCFSKDTGHAVEAVGGIAVIWYGIKKWGPKIVNFVKNFRA